MSRRPEVVDGHRRRLPTAAWAFGGLVLFAYVVRCTGLTEIADGIQRVGWGLAAILALAGFRFMLRAACWRLCLPPGGALTYRKALAAFLAGDAVGNVTSLGLLASEPAKVFLTRRHLATSESVASLTVENLIYAASVVGMVAIGLLIVVVTMPLAAPMLAVNPVAVVSLAVVRKLRSLFWSAVGLGILAAHPSTTR